MTQEERTNFAENLHPFLVNCSKIIGKPIEMSADERFQEELKRRNTETEKRLKENYNYTNACPVLRLTIPAIDTDLHLRTDENYFRIKKDLLEELLKFGEIVTAIMPRPQDLNDAEKSKTIQPTALKKLFV